jgi:hypothetical protein
VEPDVRRVRRTGSGDTVSVDRPRTDKRKIALGARTLGRQGLEFYRNSGEEQLAAVFFVPVALPIGVVARPQQSADNNAQTSGACIA